MFDCTYLWFICHTIIVKNTWIKSYIVIQLFQIIIGHKCDLPDYEPWIPIFTYINNNILGIWTWFIIYTFCETQMDTLDHVSIYICFTQFPVISEPIDSDLALSRNDHYNCMKLYWIIIYHYRFIECNRFVMALLATLFMRNVSVIYCYLYSVSI